MFLEISQNSQENTFARVSFLIKLQACVSLPKLNRNNKGEVYKRERFLHIRERVYQKGFIKAFTWVRGIDEKLHKIYHNVKYRAFTKFPVVENL